VYNVPEIPVPPEITRAPVEVFVEEAPFVIIRGPVVAAVASKFVALVLVVLSDVIDTLVRMVLLAFNDVVVIFVTVKLFKYKSAIYK
jgi:hypothetical protein